MNLDDANAVLVLLSAGFPRQEWPEATKRLWRLELEPVGATEGLAAARAVVHGHEFLTFAAYFKELAHVREQFHDERRSDLSRPALPPVPERYTPKEEAKAHIAAIRAELATKKGPLVGALGRVVAGPPPPPRYPGAAPARPDETYFNPPEPAPEPPGEVL